MLRHSTVYLADVVHLLDNNHECNFNKRLITKRLELQLLTLFVTMVTECSSC